MPKASISLNQFEGGLNNHSDPRDIGGEADNQLSEATGIDLQYKGRITNMVSGQVDTTLNLGNQVNGTAGYGLFSFSADYKEDGDLEDTDYYLHCVDGVVTAKTSGGVTATGLQMVTEDTDSKPCFFVADGAVRISDGEFGNTDAGNITQFAKYIINDGVGSLGTTGAWIKGNSKLTPPTSGASGLVVTNNTTHDSNVSANLGKIQIVPRVGAADETAVGWAADTSDALPAHTDAINSSIYWEFGASFVYDEDQETTITTATGVNDSTIAERCDVSANGVQMTTGYKYEIRLMIPTAAAGLTSVEGKERITMVKTYMRKKNGGTPWFLCGEFNINVSGGGRSPFEDEYNGWTNSGFTGGYYATTSQLKQPPQSVTFRSETGYDADSGLSYEARFQTACVVNRRAYIGNVFQSGKVYGDRMLKTGANQFDLYPEGNWIDVVINDGDYITALLVYADRIFQFKRRNLYLLNVAEDTEFLEGQYLNYGIMHPSQACVSSYGVLWVNEHGCFRYDGESVIDLSSDRIKLSEFGITESATSIPGIAYSERLRKLFICPDLSDTGATFDGTGGWAYDFVNEGWSKLPIGFWATGMKSNLHVDFNGDIVYMEGSDLLKVGTAATSTSDYEVRTKDLDFGSTGVLKKTYKTYITYRCTSDSNIKVAYALNGDDDTWTEIEDELLNTSGEWSTVALTSKATAYTYRLRLYDNGSSVPADFEVNDISITYRLRTAK
jgi:hypothetical protein